jgi:hypothetical protein
MARKPRLEVEGGLYHLITRGVDRREFFPVARGLSEISHAARRAENEAAVLFLHILPDDKSYPFFEKKNHQESRPDPISFGLTPFLSRGKIFESRFKLIASILFGRKMTESNRR